MGGKANFLGDLHPYHLYAWELFEKTDIMDGVMGMLDGSTTASGITTPGEDSWGNKTLDRKHKCEESHHEAMIDLARTVKEVLREMKTQDHRNILTSLEARRQKLLDDRHSLRGVRHKSTDEEEKDKIEEDLNLIMTDLKSIEDQIKEVEENIVSMRCSRKPAIATITTKFTYLANLLVLASLILDPQPHPSTVLLAGQDHHHSFHSVFPYFFVHRGPHLPGGHCHPSKV